MAATAADRELVSRIRAGEESAWRECIDQFQGRLLAFVRGRLKETSLAEDIVQETFIGFLTALPNFDEQTPVQSFLYSIAAHKITDHLRRAGRRPLLPIGFGSDSTSASEPIGSVRRASSLARSREARVTEEAIVAQALKDLIGQWRDRGEFERWKCLELLCVRGLANKAVAEELHISEQSVANHKFFFIGKLKEAATRAGLREFDAEAWQLR